VVVAEAAAFPAAATWKRKGRAVVVIVVIVVLEAAPEAWFEVAKRLPSRKRKRKQERGREQRGASFVRFVVVRRPCACLGDTGGLLGMHDGVCFGGACLSVVGY